MADARAQGTHSLQNLITALMPDLVGRVSEEVFCRLVPVLDFTIFGDGKGRIRRPFQQPKQLTFEHLQFLALRDTSYYDKYRTWRPDLAPLGEEA